ncbi:MAG: hypothetical protein WCK81_13000, partial [Betaproteobacteria bacterium]
FDPLVPNQMRYQAALRPDSEYSNRLQQGNWLAAAKSLFILADLPAFSWIPRPLPCFGLTPTMHSRR